MRNIEAWIGRVDVKPRSDNNVLDGAKGAIVNVVALAFDEEAYQKIVSKTMRESGFDVICYTDVTRLKDWTRENHLHPDLERLAASLTDKFPIQFDEFQAYDSDDA